MMPPVLIYGIAAAVGVAAALATWLGLRPANAGRTPAAPVPPEVERVVRAVREHKASADDLRAAARQAARAGHADLAAAMHGEAVVLAAAEELAGAEIVELAAAYPSPLRGVTDAAWTVYVRRSRSARPSAVTADGRHGCYGLTARELADVGQMTEARKAMDGGRARWAGVWAPGRSEAAFLADPDAQYDALAALTRLHTRAIGQRHVDLLGQVIEGRAATLSGLLGVARRAGLGGLRGWACDAAQRARFAETTAAYARLNGLF